MVSRRNFLIRGSLGALAVGAGAAVRSVTHAGHASAVPTPTTPPSFSVADYGAYPNGSDATSGFQQAIDAAQAHPGGGIVRVPPGTYTFSAEMPGYQASLVADGTYPVFLQGPGGMNQTTLVQQVLSQTLLSIRTHGSQVSGLTLDCKTFTGGSCLVVSANDTLLTNSRALGSKAQKAFTLYYPGPKGATTSNPSYNANNSITNCEVTDEIEDDGISYSYQSGGVISNIAHTGSRLALYVCMGTSVSDYTYTPNPDCNVSRFVTNGYYITPPSKNITISDFSTSGYGGVIGGNAQHKECTGITILREKFLPPTMVPSSTGALVPSVQRIEIGTVQGLAITDGVFAGSDSKGNPYQASLYFDTPVSSVGVTVAASGVTPLTIPGVRFLCPPGATVDATFTNVAFPGFNVLDSTGTEAPSPTFRNLATGANAPVPTVTVKGGTYNASNGAGYSEGAFTVSTADGGTYGIEASYPGLSPISLVAPAIVAAPTTPPTKVITHGTALDALHGSWSSTDADPSVDTNTYSYAWANQTGPVGTDSPTYTVATGDKSITVTVTATNSFGPSTPATSAAVTVS